MTGGNYHDLTIDRGGRSSTNKSDLKCIDTSRNRKTICGTSKSTTNSMDRVTHSSSTPDDDMTIRSRQEKTTLKRQNLHSGGGRSLALDDKMPSIKTVLGLVLVLCSSVGFTAAEYTTTGDLPPPCDSNIYCHGDLLKTVQLAHLFNDSKYFVDMTLKSPPDVINQDFDKLMQDTNQDPSKEQLGDFVEQHFNDPGTEFETWTPDDWSENPPFLQNISDPQYREWAADLHAIWKDLGRRISSDVRDQPDRYSQLYVDNPVVVPGGRFREVYYWDSYWTIDGLLLSGMTTTVKGMLENFLQMVEVYGMVPNGGRVYYTRRSQPPYLMPMIKLYVDHTGDMQFVSDNIAQMEREFNFWVNNRSIDVSYEGKTYSVAQYNSQVDEPRPESYREDYEVAQTVPEGNRTQLYVEYKSGAESGWDYSSRWFVDGESNKGSLKNLAVTSIAPVDLNSLLCLNARIIGDYYRELENKEKADHYQAVYETKRDTLTELFWDETDGVWYDVNIKSMTKRRFFYLSNIHPLWSRSYNESNGEAVVAKVVNYLQKQKVLDYIGGVPTSKQNTGQQWDYPNAWAPLQHLVVMALREHRSLHPELDAISLQLAEKWVRSNWQGYEDIKAMFEKYNVNLIGAPGGGGEYDVQLGFGWTNGVALRFLNEFGDRLESPSETTEDSTVDSEVTSDASSLHASKVISANYLLPVVVAASYLAR